VLLDDSTAVDAHNLPVGKCLSDDAQSFCVEIGLVVGGYQHCTIDDQIVGISCRQTVAIVIDGTWQREFQETVGLTIESPKFLELSLHFDEVGMVFIPSCI
jgi:hypothetical protein